MSDAFGFGSGYNPMGGQPNMGVPNQGYDPVSGGPSGKTNNQMQSLGTAPAAEPMPWDRGGPDSLALPDNPAFSQDPLSAMSWADDRGYGATEGTRQSIDSINDLNKRMMYLDVGLKGWDYGDRPEKSGSGRVNTGKQRAWHQDPGSHDWQPENATAADEGSYEAGMKFLRSAASMSYEDLKKYMAADPGLKESYKHIQQLDRTRSSYVPGGKNSIKNPYKSAYEMLLNRSRSEGFI